MNGWIALACGLAALWLEARMDALVFYVHPERVDWSWPARLEWHVLKFFYRPLFFLSGIFFSFWFNLNHFLQDSFFSLLAIVFGWRWFEFWLKFWKKKIKDLS